MRFHVVAIPQTNVSEEHSSSAFNQKVLNFCRMMMGLNHQVFLYSSEKTTAVFTEHITCISEAERLASLHGKHYTQASFNPRLPHWRKFNETAIEGIRKRIQPHDFICVIGGGAHKVIADAFPQYMTVEFGIGYPGVFAKYQVYESYAWMHMTLGAIKGSYGGTGNFYAAVIPGYYDVNDFPAGDPEDYYLYIGRLVQRKGWQIAQYVCQRLGKRLVVAGPGEFSGYGEYVGEIGPAHRGKLLSHALAVFSPTLYVEPFGSAHVEAMLCGTPVITTDWGAYTETFQHGVHGFRCYTLPEFAQATEAVKRLDRQAIRAYAQKRFSLDIVAQQYELYFKRLLSLGSNGFYAPVAGKNITSILPENQDS